VHEKRGGSIKRVPTVRTCVSSTPHGALIGSVARHGDNPDQIGLVTFFRGKFTGNPSFFIHFSEFTIPFRAYRESETHAVPYRGFTVRRCGTIPQTCLTRGAVRGIVPHRHGGTAEIFGPVPYHHTAPRNFRGEMPIPVFS
jgi:hypothetical protein